MILEFLFGYRKRLGNTVKFFPKLVEQKSPKRGSQPRKLAFEGQRLGAPFRGSFLFVIRILNTKPPLSICTCLLFPCDMHAKDKKKELLKTEVDKIAGFYDLDALEVVVAAGWHNFAYVPKAKLRHYHVTSLRNLIKKRLRNLDGNYFSTTDKKYAWFDINSPKDLDKIIYWIVYANLFFPELVRGLWESFVKSDWAFMWRPVVSLVITDVLLWGFISRSKGREIIKKVLGLSQ